MASIELTEIYNSGTCRRPFDPDAIVHYEARQKGGSLLFTADGRPHVTQEAPAAITQKIRAARRGLDS